jgi:hypothetical protein
VSVTKEVFPASPSEETSPETQGFLVPDGYELRGSFRLIDSRHKLSSNNLKEVMALVSQYEPADILQRIVGFVPYQELRPVKDDKGNIVLEDGEIVTELVNLQKAGPAGVEHFVFVRSGAETRSQKRKNGLGQVAITAEIQDQ